MAINYYLHFLLTILLLDLLKQSAPSRIVNVSSSSALCIWNLNLNKLEQYGKWFLYCRTKLCQIYFTQELAKRLEGTGVTSYSFHPGIIYTDAYRFSKVVSWFASKLFISAEKGAQTKVYAAIEEGIEKYSGGHFENCRKVKPYWGAQDDQKRMELWELSEERVGLREKTRL